MSLITIFAIISIVSLPLIDADDPCRFEDPFRGVIDLTSVAQVDGTFITDSNYKYMYSPCRSISHGTTCINASICQISENGRASLRLSTHENAKWNAKFDIDDVPSITYTSFNRTTIVELVCPDDDVSLFEVLNDTSINTYKFRLTHKCACWDGCEVPQNQTCNPSCNDACQTCTNGICTIDNGTCFIEGRCHAAGETFSNESVSCLQCQPQNSQVRWSFNPICSPGNQCGNILFIGQNRCSPNLTQAFYQNPTSAEIDLYDFSQCGRDRQQCQAGFLLERSTQQPLACCPGFFCPVGQVCMIPCRPGSYCPSPLQANNATCETPVKCPERAPARYERHGCGGSTFEGFCPAGTYCGNSTISLPCPNGSSYCPTGVIEPLPCLSQFNCYDGVAHRGSLFRVIMGIILAFLIAYFIIALVSQNKALAKLCKRTSQQVDLTNVSRYFQQGTPDDNHRTQFQLNIHLRDAQLRDVTRFDYTKNEGFTGRIRAGNITALMGGSGCGKSSLLDTIHGRRRLYSGDIRFARHEPLTNVLTDYIGYVPQADIMHKDLTVFETVYYSARTRRLGDDRDQIKNDAAFVLQKLGLGNMHNSMTETLSGGQKKRVNVAMEVAACPKVLLLDEPTSGLDTASCDDLFDLLELIKYSKDGPVTIIMVIHQPSYELFQRIDHIFFLTPNCCLAYQGPREHALKNLEKAIFQNNLNLCPKPRQNESDTCFIMLTYAKDHIDNHRQDDEPLDQSLHTYSWQRRAFLPFIYVMARSIKQVYVRSYIAEAAYLLAYFLLGACLGYLFAIGRQPPCNIEIWVTIYFLISLAFGILTCISSQRLFGVEIIDKTYERESRNYFHPFQYWLAKSGVDIFRLIIYPLVFLSMLYIQVVPRTSFTYFYGVMLLLSFACMGIGQLCSVIFSRTEYAYLAGTILALLSCLLSGFSPTKEDLGPIGFVTTFTFSRHVQHLLYRHETELYLLHADNATHLWYGPITVIQEHYSFKDSENPYFWLIGMGFVLRLITLFILYIKSEYRSKHRFRATHLVPIAKGLFTCETCRRKRPRHTSQSMLLNTTP